MMESWPEDAVRAYFESGGSSSSKTDLASESVAMTGSVSPRQRHFTVIKVFGDSHANSFISLDTLGDTRLLAYPYTAGSAMGLRHADSITGYREALEGDLYDTRASDAIVFKFGQVMPLPEPRSQTAALAPVHSS